jgi:phage portal protein BeeE
VNLLTRLLRREPEIARYNVGQYIEDLSQAYGGYRYLGSPGWTKTEDIETSFTGYINGLYKSNGIVFAIVLARMLLFTEARFCWFEVGDNGENGRPKGRDGLELLEQPWPNCGTGELLARMEQDVSLGGNFYAVREGSRLRRLRPDWVTIVLTAPPAESTYADVAGYWYHPGRSYTSAGEPSPGDEVYLPDECCHWSPLPDPDAQYRGMSWLTPAVKEVQADKAASDHKLSFFTNGATLGVIISAKESLTNQQYKEWKANFEGIHSGAGNAYKSLFLASPVDTSVLTANMQQLDFKVVQGAGETRLCALGGVPPIIVGLSEGLASATYSNYGMARRKFGDHWGHPQWRSAAQALSSLVDPPSADVRLGVNTKGIAFLREDAKDLAEIEQIKASTLSTLIMAGYEPDSCVAAVEAEDLSLLKHSGLTSVQLVPPGQDPAAMAEEETADQEEYDVLLDEFRAELADEDEIQRDRYDVRNPRGSVGGGRFRKLSDAIVALLKDWNGEGDPLDGWTQPQLKKAATQLGIDVPPRSSAPKLKSAILAHARGDRKPDVKAPAKKATPRAPAKKAAPPERVLDSIDPRDNGAKLKFIRDEETGETTVTLYRRIAAGPSGQTKSIPVGRLRYIPDGPYEFRVSVDGDLAGYVTQEGDQWLTHSVNYDGDISFLGRASSAAVGADVLTTGSVHHATGRHDSRRLDGGRFEGPRPAKPDAPGAKPDSVQLARQRQADIDTARGYADAAAQLDELLANDASTAALLSRLDNAGKRHGIAEDLAPVRAAVEEAGRVELDNKIRAAYVAVLARRGLTARPGDTQWAGLADLRDELGESVNRHELDEALRRMSIGDPGTNLVPESNQKTLRPEDREAAVSQGNQAKHLIAIDDPSPRPVPDARAAMAAILSARGITPDGQAGDTARFTRGVHQPIDGDLREGQAVQVVRPGHTLTRDGEQIRLSRAVVEAVDDPASDSPRAAGGKDITGSIDAEALLDAGDGRASTKEIFRRQGFDGLPEVVDTAALDAAIGDGAIELYRGTSAERADDFRRGEYHVSEISAFGEGTYAAPAEHIDLAMRYAGEGGLIRMALRPDARTITRDDLDAERRHRAPQWDTAEHVLYMDDGRFAAALGYDALIPSSDPNSRRGGGYLILNRTAVIVQREPGDPARAQGRRAADELAGLASLDADQLRDSLDLKKVDGPDGLKAMLKSRGLKVSGRKRELVDRLVEHAMAGDSATGPEAPGVEVVPGGGGDPDALTPSELTAIGKLSTAGRFSDGGWVRVGDMAPDDRAALESLAKKGFVQKHEAGGVVMFRIDPRTGDARKGTGSDALVGDVLPATVAPESRLSLSKINRGAIIEGYLNPDGSFGNVPEDGSADPSRIIRVVVQRKDPVDENGEPVRGVFNQTHRRIVGHDAATGRRLESTPVAGGSYWSWVMNPDTDTSADIEGEIISDRFVAGEVGASARRRRSGPTRAERIRQLMATGLSRKEAEAQIRQENASRSEEPDPDDIVRADYDESGDEECTDEELDEIMAEMDAAGISRAMALDGDEFEAYWTTGEGLGRWRFHPHPWTRLRSLLRQIRLKHGRGPRDPEGLASTYFRKVFGYWPGHRKGDNPVGPG